MNDQTFWTIIGLIDWSTGDDERAVEQLVNTLKVRDKDEITAFDDLLAAKLYALDTRQHAAEWASMNSGRFSPDGFLYGRCHAVASGHTIYEDIARGAHPMPADVEFEYLLYVAPRAFEGKTGRTYEHVPAVSPETFSNLDGWRP